jgi:hypothetical protein
MDQKGDVSGVGLLYSASTRNLDITIPDHPTVNKLGNLAQ